MRFVAVFLSVFFLAQAIPAATIHVPADQPTIQAGIDAAVDGDTVLVGPGTFVENISFQGKRVILRSDSGPDLTTIIALSNTDPVVTFNGGPSGAEISGFTIKEGGRSGIFCYNSSPTIQNNIVTANSSHSSNDGGGISLKNTLGAVVKNNKIYGNHAQNFGCAIHVGDDTTFSHNDTICYNILYDNTGENWDIRVLGDVSALAIFNNTIVGGSCHAFLHQGAGGVDVRNNIICNYSCYALYDDPSYPGSTICEYNCLYNNANTVYGIIPGAGMIYENPLFTSMTQHDFSLTMESPCIDAGDSDPQYNDPDGTRNDMGAFPYNQHAPTTIVVPDQYPTIQIAIDSSWNQDTILLRDGTYYEHVVIYDKSIVLMSENGYASCSLVSDTSRCLTIRKSTVDIANITFTGTSDGRGGAIHIDSCVVNIINSIVANSTAYEEGGGIYCINSRLTLTDCIVANNEAWGYASEILGGGIYCRGILILDSCRILANSASGYEEPQFSCSNYGGGVYVMGDSVIIRRCVVTGNSCGYSDGAGGGIYASGGTIAVENCTVNQNRILAGEDAMPRGGGIAVAGVAGIIRNNWISDNYATSGAFLWPVLQGGGIAIFYSSLVVDSNIIANNSLEFSCTDGPSGTISVEGAGLYAYGPTDIRNNTIVSNIGIATWDVANPGGSNAATIFGAGASVYGGEFYNNVVAYNVGQAVCMNSGDSSACLDTVYGSGVYSQYTVIGCNIYFGNSPGNEWDISLGSTPDTNMNVNPQFCLGSEYYISENSPAAASNNPCGQLIGAQGIGCPGQPAMAGVSIIQNSPMNVVDHNPQFSWSYSCPIGNPEDSFELAVGDDNDWQYAEMWNPEPFPGPDTFVTYAGVSLIDGETYYTRLRVHNGLAWSEWYEVSFRMNSVPGVPEAISPVGGHVVGSLTPELYIQNSSDAEGDELTYDFIVYPDTSFVLTLGEGIAQQSDSTGWIVDVALEENRKFLWAARANDGYELSAWSPLDSFWVNATEQYPSAFDLIFPPDTGWSQVHDFPTTFRWGAADDPDPFDSVFYRLKIAIDSNFVFVATYDSIYQTTYDVPSLNYSTHYWWKVYAIDIKGNMTQSNNVADFMTWVLGDANADGSANLADAVFLINFIFKGGLFPDPYKIGDVNADCEVNLADAVYLINYIFKGGDPPGVGCATGRIKAEGGSSGFPLSRE